MMIKGQTRIILVMVVITIFFFQNCVTIARGPSQKIPVTSNPIGAKIIVDGEEMGDTPLSLKLKRKKEHLIRIEKHGYNSLEIKITRKPSALSSVLVNVFWGIICGTIAGILPMRRAIITMQEEEWKKASTSILLGFIVGWGGAILVDVLSGATYTLHPKDLIVTLTKIEEKSQTNFILIDAKRFQHVKWIRIKLGGSEEG